MTGTPYVDRHDNGVAIAQNTIDLFHEEAMKAKERGGWGSEGSSLEESEQNGFERVLDGLKAVLGMLERCGKKEIEKDALKLYWKPLESRVNSLLYDDESDTDTTDSGTDTQYQCLCGRDLPDDYVGCYKDAVLHELPHSELTRFLSAHDVASTGSKQSDLEKVISMIREEELRYVTFASTLHFTSSDSSLCPISAGDVTCPDLPLLQYSDVELPRVTDTPDIEAGLEVVADGSVAAYTPTNLSLTPAVGWHASVDEKSPMPKIPLLDGREEEKPKRERKSGSIQRTRSAVVKRLSGGKKPSVKKNSAGTPPRRRASEPIVRTSKIGERLAAQTTAAAQAKKQETRRRKSVTHISSVVAQQPNFMKPTKGKN